jgi:hypothetical protein
MNLKEVNERRKEENKKESREEGVVEKGYGV